MDDQDLRWHQRIGNFTKAFNQLERFIGEDELNEMKVSGMNISAF